MALSAEAIIGLVTLLIMCIPSFMIRKLYQKLRSPGNQGSHKTSPHELLLKASLGDLERGTELRNIQVDAPHPISPPWPGPQLGAHGWQYQVRTLFVVSTNAGS